MVLRADLVSLAEIFQPPSLPKYIKIVGFVVLSSTNKTGPRISKDQILHVLRFGVSPARTGNTGRCSQLACLGCSASVTSNECVEEMIGIDLVMIT